MYSQGRNLLAVFLRYQAHKNVRSVQFAVKYRCDMDFSFASVSAG